MLQARAALIKGPQGHWAGAGTRCRGTSRPLTPSAMKDPELGMHIPGVRRTNGGAGGVHDGPPAE